MGGMKHASAPIIPTIEEIERFVEDAGSDDLPTFGGNHVGGIYIQQIPDEVAPCIHAVQESGETINSYLEIGVAAGGMTYLMDHYFHPENIVLIDTNEHPRCVNRPQVLAGITTTEIIGKSGDESTWKRMSALCKVYDAMMIDGVHYYENVKRDVEIYAPYLRDGGFLMLHDSALQNWGVPRVVAELKENTAFQFIGEWTTKTGRAACGVALFQKIA